MNDVRFLTLLWQKAGGWEMLAEPVDLTVRDASGKKILKSAQDVYEEILEEANQGGTAKPAAPAAAKGRRAIIREGVTGGLSLEEVQARLAGAGLPGLYPRVGSEAAVEYLLLLNGRLGEILPKSQLESLRKSWLKALQQSAAEETQRRLSADGGDSQAARRQREALARLRSAIQQARCCYRDLAEYVDEVFVKGKSGYQTAIVTSTVSDRLTRAAEAAARELHAGMDPEAVLACLDSHWCDFLERAGEGLVQNQLNAQNYLARALVRGLDALFAMLADITAELYPPLPAADARRRLYGVLTEDSYQSGLNDLFYPSAVLAALFSQDRSLTAEDTLPEKLQEESNWKELPAPLKPFFCFYEEEAKVPLSRSDRVAAARAHWAAQPLYLGGVARLLLGLLDYGDENGGDSQAHREVMAQLYAESGGYLSRVLRGEADLDRNVFLLFLLLAEDICARQMPRREQISARLGVDTRNRAYTNLLGNCGFPLLSSRSPFDAALWAALEADLPATQRKGLFVKALLLCEQAGSGNSPIPPVLGMEAADCSGSSEALNQVFEQLGKGRHAGAYAGRR